MGEHEGIFRRQCRARRLMNIRHGTVGSGKRGNEALIRPIIDVDQSEIVILAVSPPALRMVAVLKPVETDNLGDRREISDPRRRAARSLVLGLARAQMALVTVPGAVFARGEKPFGDE